jgi:UDP-glucose 4-epimerase
MARLAVFGANGFIGQHFISYLKARKIEILPFDRSGNNVICADLRLPGQYINHLESCDAVILAASTTNPATVGNTIDKEISLNIEPHQIFLRAIEPLQLRHVIFLSSGGTVYGHQGTSLPIREDSTLSPVQPYGWGKVQIERSLRDFSERSRTAVTILRPANPVGTSQAQTGIGFVSAALDCATTGRVLSIWGSGAVVRDYFDVNDLCRAVLLTVKKRPPSGIAINIGSGVGRSQIEIVNLVSRVIGRSIRTEFLPSRENEITRNILNIQRAKTLLGWEPEIPLDETVRKLNSRDRGMPT